MTRTRRLPSIGRRLRAIVVAALVGPSLLAGIGLACTPGAPPSDLPDAIARVEADLPSVPEVVRHPDAKTVLEALRRPPTPTVGSYDAAARVYGAPLDPTSDVQALRAWAVLAARGVRAYGLFVEDETGGRIVAAGAYWVSPLVSRLQVVRLDAPIDGRTPDAEALAAVGSCHVGVRDWIVIPSEVANDLLRASEEVQVYLVASGGPDEQPVRRWLDGAELLEAASFVHPATAGLGGFSAWFVGSGPGPLVLARALPKVRATLGPGDLWELIRGIR